MNYPHTVKAAAIYSTSFPYMVFILLALLRLLLYTLLPSPTWSLYDYSKISKSQFSSHGIHFIPFGTFIEVPKLSRPQLLRLSDTKQTS